MTETGPMASNDADAKKKPGRPRGTKNVKMSPEKKEPAVAVTAAAATDPATMGNVENSV